MVHCHPARGSAPRITQLPAQWRVVPGVRVRLLGHSSELTARRRAASRPAGGMAPIIMPVEMVMGMAGGGMGGRGGRGPG